MLTQARCLAAMQLMQALQLVPSPLRTYLPILEDELLELNLPMASYGCSSDDVIREPVPVRLHKNKTGNLHHLSLTTPQGQGNRHRHFSKFNP